MFGDILKVRSGEYVIYSLFSPCQGIPGKAPAEETIQMLNCLLNKHEDLGSIPGPILKKARHGDMHRAGEVETRGLGPDGQSVYLTW